jgi:inner membrane transporter RhtA
VPFRWTKPSLRGAIGLALLAQVSVNSGSGFAVRAFEVAGPAAMVLLRNGLGAIILLAVIRPRLRGVPRRAWAAVGCYGLALVVMNSFFYEAIGRLPVGPAVTVEMTGPLVLSVILSRRLRGWLWAAMAAGGVALISGFDVAQMNLAGTGLALCAGAAWACYILCARWVGKAFSSADGLALGMAVSALLAVPRGVVDLAVRPWTPAILGWGVLVALLATAIPYGMEMLALRGMPAAVFSVMTSVAPATAALAGWVIAGQSLTGWVLGGMALVAAASAGAALTERGDRRRARAQAAAAVVAEVADAGQDGDVG